MTKTKTKAMTMTDTDQVDWMEDGDNMHVSISSFEFRLLQLNI